MEQFHKADKIIEDIQKATDKLRQVLAEVEENKNVLGSRIK